MSLKIEIQSIRPGDHEPLKPGRTVRISRLQVLRSDEELHAQILIERFFAFGLGQATQSIDVVALDPIEIILGLRVHHSEDRVAITLAVNVRNSPIVADDGRVLSLEPPALDFLARN